MELFFPIFSLSFQFDIGVWMDSHVEQIYLSFRALQRELLGKQAIFKTNLNYCKRVGREGGGLKYLWSTDSIPRMLTFLNINSFAVNPIILAISCSFK